MTDRRIKVVGKWRDQPEIRLFVLALLELARRQQDEAEAQQTKPTSEGSADV